MFFWFKSNDKVIIITVSQERFLFAQNAFLLWHEISRKLLIGKGDPLIIELEHREMANLEVHGKAKL